MEEDTELERAWFEVQMSRAQVNQSKEQLERDRFTLSVAIARFNAELTKQGVIPGTIGAVVIEETLLNKR